MPMVHEYEYPETWGIINIDIISPLKMIVVISSQCLPPPPFTLLLQLAPVNPTLHEH